MPNMFGGFWFGVWIIFLILIAFIPCVILGLIRFVIHRESVSDCIGYYYEKWFQFIDKV